MTADANARAQELIDKGSRYLEEGHDAKAERCFRRSVQLVPTSPALNNWALCRFRAGDAHGTLAILEPMTSASDLAPYSRALACRALHRLGDEVNARGACEERSAIINEAAHVPYEPMDDLLIERMVKRGIAVTPTLIVHRMYRRSSGHRFCPPHSTMCGASTRPEASLPWAMTMWTKRRRGMCLDCPLVNWSFYSKQG